MDDSTRRRWTVLCVATLYVVWSSTYLAQRLAVATVPPLWMAALRFLASGVLLYPLARALGAPRPSLRGALSAGLSAVPLLVTGMGLASLAVARVSSGALALVFATVPLWTALLGAARGERLREGELAGLGLGLSGVVLVAVRGSLRADPVGLLLAVGAAASYAVGCAATRRLPLPPGMMGTAVQMLTAGALLVPVALALGPLPSRPSASSLAALAYLVLLGSVVAYTALGFLLRNSRPALATSYAFVNPPLALALGAALGREQVRSADLAGMGLVLLGVVALAAPSRRKAEDSLPEPRLATR